MHIDDIFQHTFKAIGQQLGLRVRMVDGHLQIKDLMRHPNCKAYTIWYNTAQQVMQSFFWPRSNVIYVSDFLERYATAEQKERKIDLVDFIIESRS